MKLQSKFAVLHVQKGWKGLLKQLEKAEKQKAGPGIPVVITGFIAGPYGGIGDDRMDFSIAVVQVEVMS